MNDLRIVLLGKTGSGKSSFANTLFGGSLFVTGSTSNSETCLCQSETREVHGEKITLIDTPGFFDSRMSDDAQMSAITECITMCSPGPHAFLIFLKVERFTEQENEVISNIKKLFSKGALKYAMVVFTHGDQLDEGKEIDEFINGNPDLCDLLRRCGGRCCVVDNKYWKNNPQEKYRNNQKQVEKLLNSIKEMVDKNKASFYTNEMLEAVEREIQEEEEYLRSSSRDATPEEIRKQARKNISKGLKTALGVTTGVLLGALLGVPVMIAKVISALTKMKGKTRAAGSKGAVGAAAVVVEAVATGVVAGVAVGASAAAGAVVGGRIGYDEADRADSVGKAVKNTAKAVGGRASRSFKKMMDNLQLNSCNDEPLLKD